MDNILSLDREVFGDPASRRKALANEVFAGKSAASIRQLARRGWRCDPDAWPALSDPGQLVGMAERHSLAVWDVLDEVVDVFGMDIREWFAEVPWTDIDTEFMALATEHAVEALARELAYGSVCADTEDDAGFGTLAQTGGTDAG